MVEDIDRVFHALAHSARREMIAQLAKGERTVGELAEPLPMSLWAASKHVQVLEHAGLIDRRVDGRRHLCSLRVGSLASASAWLHFYEPHWQQSLDRLQALMQADPNHEGEDQ
jgi:DNA-binding transcriptional ArsR family regulator